MAKIKTEHWLFPIRIESKYWQDQENERYLITEGFSAWRTASGHGTSSGKAKCPCCSAVSDIYLWSFAGSGKRCNNCGVLMVLSGAIVEKKDIKHLQVTESEILRG